ncbi:MAG: hypothetical protein Q4A55_05310 [Aerococcus sp.]|nr:hypothetical protein [Aerococcus sp.]
MIQKLKFQVMSFIHKNHKYNSYKGKIGKTAPNRIHRRFNTSVPHQKLTTDTSEFKYYEVDDQRTTTVHKLYLDPFMDLCNNEIVSYRIGKKPTVQNVLDTLDDAISLLPIALIDEPFTPIKAEPVK